MRKMWIIQFRC